MEKTIAFAPETGQKQFNASLCKLVEKFVEILASQGLLTTAMEYLKLMGTDDLSPELVVLRDHIARSTEISMDIRFCFAWFGFVQLWNVYAATAGFGGFLILSFLLPYGIPMLVLLLLLSYRSVSIILIAATGIDTNWNARGFGMPMLCVSNFGRWCCLTTMSYSKSISDWHNSPRIHAPCPFSSSFLVSCGQ
ncbi:hypothetical protein U1Q18_045263, partial [Sarracenia purpurea var. burkii]